MGYTIKLEIDDKKYKLVDETTHSCDGCIFFEGWCICPIDDDICESYSGIWKDVSPQIIKTNSDLYLEEKLAHVYRVLNEAIKADYPERYRQACQNMAIYLSEFGEKN